MKLLLFILLLLPSSLVAQSGTSWESNLAERWQVVNVSNGHIHIGLAPQLGGRLIALQRQGGEQNLLHLQDNAYLHLTADDVPAHLPLPRPGGMWDVVSPFRLAELDPLQPTRVQVLDDPIRIRTEANIESIRHERIFKLLPSSSIMIMESTLSNESEGWARLGLTAQADFVPRPAGPLDEAATELVLLDAEKRSILILRIPEGEGYFQEVTAVPPIVPNPAPFSVGIQQEPRLVAPGDKLSFHYECLLYRGLTAIDLRHDDILLQVDLDRPAYRAGETILVSVGAARPTMGPVFDVSMKAGEFARDITFSSPQPGVSQWFEWRLPDGFAADGEYPVTLSAFGQRHTIIAHVASERFAALDEQLEIANRIIGEIAAAGTLAKRTEAAMGRARLAAIRNLVEAREIDQADTQVVMLLDDLTRWRNEAR